MRAGSTAVDGPPPYLGVTGDGLLEVGERRAQTAAALRAAEVVDG